LGRRIFWEEEYFGKKNILGRKKVKFEFTYRKYYIYKKVGGKPSLTIPNPPKKIKWTLKILYIIKK